MLLLPLEVGNTLKSIAINLGRQNLQRYAQQERDIINELGQRNTGVVQQINQDHADEFIENAWANKKKFKPVVIDGGKK